METNQPPKVLKWALIVGIVIVLNLFVNYSLSLIFINPEYDNFCEDKFLSEPATTVEECAQLNGKWTPYIDAELNRPEIAPLPENKATGYCDIYSECSKSYDEARDNHERNIFISLISFGVIIFALSLALKNNYVISVSFGLAAVLDFIIASMRYWSSAENITRVIILALALGILIYLAYKKFKD
jgi:hypothetical protein